MQPYEFRHVRGGSWHAGFALAGRRSSRPLHVHPLCTRLFDRRGHEERDPQQASGHNPLRAGRGSGRQSATPLIEMSPRALEPQWAQNCATCASCSAKRGACPRWRLGSFSPDVPPQEYKLSSHSGTGAPDGRAAHFIPECVR